MNVHDIFDDMNAYLPDDTDLDGLITMVDMIAVVLGLCWLSAVLVQHGSLNFQGKAVHGKLM